MIGRWARANSIVTQRTARACTPASAPLREARATPHEKNAQIIPPAIPINAEQPRGGQRVHIAILLDHDGNPRKANRVKHKAVKEAVKRSHPQRRLKGGEDQQPDRNPGQKRETVVWKGKRQGQPTRQSEQHARMPGKLHSALDDSFETGVIQSVSCGFRGVFDRDKVRPALG